MIITSFSNEYIKRVRKLQAKNKYRAEERSFIIEGIKPVRESIRFVKKVIVSADFDISQLGDVPCETIIVDKKIMSQLSDTKTPQGVMAEVGAVDVPLEDLKNENLIIFCDRVSDPGNLGTIIRTADAAGFDGVILSGCADLYNPKTVRSTMASVFNIKINISQNGEDTISRLKHEGFTVFGSSLETEKNLFEVDFDRKNVIIVGNEASGVENNLLTMCDKYVKIPMLGKAESLNVGVAAGVIMYEAVRRVRY